MVNIDENRNIISVVYKYIIVLIVNIKIWISSFKFSGTFYVPILYWITRYIQKYSLLNYVVKNSS